MALIRWRPFEDIDQFLEEEHLAEAGLQLATDMYEDNGNVIVQMHIPGIDEDKIEISVENNHVHIAGTREEVEETKEKHFYKKEIARGSFERMLTLPCAVNKEAIKATVKDGVLTVTLPKLKPEEKKHKIKVEKK